MPPNFTKLRLHNAGVAQLVERDLPKVDVEGSRPFSRSKIKSQAESLAFYFTSDISGSRTREEGLTKSDYARSAKSGFWNFRVAKSPSG